MLLQPVSHIPTSQPACDQLGSLTVTVAALLSAVFHLLQAEGVKGQLLMALDPWSAVHCSEVE